MKKIFVLFLCISSVSFAQNSNELFATANALYKNGKYQKAIKIYTQIKDSNKVSSELYYNLGNCYYKLNKVAPTIYNYEKALRLNPNNKDAQNNLIFAKRLTLDRIEALPKTVLQQFNESFLQKLSYNSWGVLSILFSILTAVLFLLFYFAYHSSKKKMFFTTSIISFILLVTTLAIAFNQYNLSKNKIEAIIFTEKTTVKSEPTKNSDEAFTLHEGTKVNVIDAVDDWKKIRLTNGKIGWLLSKNLKEI